jgi:hypothetical protein
VINLEIEPLCLGSGWAIRDFEFCTIAILLAKLCICPHISGHRITRGLIIRGAVWWMSETNVVAVAGRIAETEEYNNLTKLEILAQLKDFPQT